MASGETVPDCDSEDYVKYLSQKITEEEECLKTLQDRCRVTEMEDQLGLLKACSFI